MKFSDFLEEIHVTTTRDTLTLVLDTKGEYKYYFNRPSGAIHSCVTDLIQLKENILSTVNVTRILLLGYLLGSEATNKCK